MEKLLTVKEISNAVRCDVFSLSNEVDFIYCTNVQTDSRNVIENSLFVPLIGQVQDGHKYVPASIKKGAKIIFIQEDEFLQNKEKYKRLLKENVEVCFITVKNTLYALQDLAEYYVKKFPSLIKISVTGSCGKTTTKEMLVSVFKAKYKNDVVYTQGNFNSETGLPLSVFNIRPNHKIGIFEMGMNRENEIGEISRVLKSKYAIITNIGTAHIGILGSKENIAKEKRKSFNYTGTDGCVFVNEQDEYADYCTKNVECKIVKFGSYVNPILSGVEYVSDKGLFGTVLRIHGVEVCLKLSGKYNYENALGVIAIANELGVETKYIKKGLESLTNISGRMEIRECELINQKKVIIINDCYNANPTSMKKLIRFVDSINQMTRKVFVLADMKELGRKARASHKEIGKSLKETDFYHAFLIGKDMRHAKKILLPESVTYIKNYTEHLYDEVAKKILQQSLDNDLIVFKGSHSMNLEAIINKIVINKSEAKDE